jgi:hypothetical protein
MMAWSMTRATLEKTMPWMSQTVVCILGFCLMSARGATVIGDEAALVSLPNHAQYGLTPHFKPGDGETPDFNPPIFSFNARTNFATSDSTLDSQVYQYQLQVFRETQMDVYTNDVVFYMGDSYTAAYNWSQYVTNYLMLKPRWQFQMAVSGDTLGRAYSNQWPLVKAMLAATNFPALQNGNGRIILEFPIGVNKNYAPSYVNPPEYEFRDWIATYSNIVWEAGQSNMLVVGFTIPEIFGDATAGTYGASTNYWPDYWRTPINNFLLHTQKLWHVVDIFSLYPCGVPICPGTDGIHPDDYHPISTNVVFTLLYSNAINVRTTSNLENRHRPFVGNESTNLNLYWRTLYIGTNGSTNAVSATRTYVVATNATNWNRSFLADDNYLTNKFSTNLLMFSAATRSNAAWFLGTNGGADKWLALTNWAATATNSAWWVATTAWDTNNFLLNSEDLGIMSVLLLSQLNTNTGTWTNRLADNIGRFTVWAHGAPDKLIFYDCNACYPLTQRTLALSYVWGRSLLSTLQRTNLLAALEKVCTFMEQGGGFYKSEHLYVATNDYTFTYDKPETSPWFNSQKYGESHISAMWHNWSLAPLAIYADSTVGRRVFDLWVNYLIGRGSPWVNSSRHMMGRGYGFANFGTPDVYGSAIFYAAALPEAGLTNSPWMKNTVDWFSRMIQPGAHEVSGEWQDGGLGGSKELYWATPTFGRNAALLTRDGVAWHHYQNQNTIQANSDNVWPDLMIEAFPMWPPGTPATNTAARLFIDDGAVISTTIAANRIDSFTNGVSVVFEARPYGPEGNHSLNSDLALQVMAYGGLSTGNGSDVCCIGGGFGFKPWANNVPLINGAGASFPDRGHAAQSSYSRITAYTNSDDFTYFVGDALGTVTNGTSSISNIVTAYRRRVLHMHRPGEPSYIAVRDEIPTGSTLTTNQLVHHIQVAGLTNLSTSGFRFPSTNYAGQTMSNYLVVAMVNGTVSNFTGTNVLRNAFTSVWTTDGDSTFRRANAVWFNSTNSVFHWLLYPVQSGASQPSTLTVSTDGAFSVVNGSQRDSITFAESSVTLDLIVTSTNNPVRFRGLKFRP